jgi:hypothetical protein
VNNDLIIMVDIDPAKSLEEHVFETIPIWICVFKLPLGWMNKENGEEIGDMIGESVDVEVGEDGNTVGEYQVIAHQVAFGAIVTDQAPRFPPVPDRRKLAASQSRPPNVNTLLAVVALPITVTSGAMYPRARQHEHGQNRMRARPKSLRRALMFDDMNFGVLLTHYHHMLPPLMEIHYPCRDAHESEAGEGAMALH